MMRADLPTIYFIRHGETDWNAEGRLQGQRDIPLNDLGRVQAEEAGRILGTLYPQPDDLDWIVSPLGRTRDTAEIARAAIGLNASYYKMDERLKELTFGDWEGLTWPEVRKLNPDGARGRERDKWNYVPPQGENYAMLCARIEPVLADLRRDTVLVSHGGVARGLMTLIAGAKKQVAVGEDIWQGKVLVLAKGTSRWEPK
jgi:broad specificity phosphatase PhoE